MAANPLKPLSRAAALPAILMALTSISGLIADDAAESARPDWSSVPGIVIDHSPAATRQYVGSPSLAVLPNGEYIAGHDWFGPGSSNNRTALFRSRDRGQSWSRIVELEGQWWSSLFFHRGALYLLGTSGENGLCVIRRSNDGGQTWTTPRDASSGLLLGDGRYHCAPVPVVEHAGRLWRGMEDAMGPDGWGGHFNAFMMSAPVGVDLLQATNWTCSVRLGRDPAWLSGNFGSWLEGNAVVTPEGKVVDFLRVDYRPPGEKAALIAISDDGRRATFDARTDFIDFPGGAKKFTIQYDPRSRFYWSLSNYVPERERGPDPSHIRNTLALVSSPDLRNWRVRSIVLHHPDPEKHGFQYVTWQFDGDDLIALSRTAYDDGFGGAHNQHDANFLTFHRVRGFRDASPDKLPAELRELLPRDRK